MNRLIQRFLSLFLTLLLIITAFSACSKPNEQTPDLRITDTPLEPENAEETGNAPVEIFSYESLLGVTIPDGALAAVINFPTDAQMEQIKSLDAVIHDKNGETMIFLPLSEGSEINIEQIAMEDNKIVATNVLYQKESTKIGYALKLCAVRTEGLPLLRVLVTVKEETGEYYIAYNGKDGNVGIEFIYKAEETPVNDKAQFSYSEVTSIFQMTEVDIKKIYGEPTEKKAGDSLGELQTYTLIYQNASFNLWYSEGNSDGMVYYAIVSDDKVAAPRSLKIGDSIQSVTNAFLDLGNTKQNIMEEASQRTYRLLYGEYKHMGNYGMIEYVSNIPVSITYVHEDISLIFELENDRIVRVYYSYQMI